MVTRRNTDPYNVPDGNVRPEIRRIPPPPHRHAAPSAPWPWIDIRDPIDEKQLNCNTPPIPKDCDHKSCQGDCWKGYPQSRFPNWTAGQVEKCKIREAIDKCDPSLQCLIYLVDVDKSGIFSDAGTLEMEHEKSRLDEQWLWFKDHKQSTDKRVRALFVRNISGPVLQMLGGKFNIEPFFFSSSLNWIPSRFQEDKREGTGDHITVTLPFIQSIRGERVPKGAYLQHSYDTLESTNHDHVVTQMIDTQAPLRMKLKRAQKKDGITKEEVEENALVLDLLSVHLVRNIDGNTIISYHANMDMPTTKADYLHERIRFAGQSVYWQKILRDAEDPTFLLLIFIWQAVYAWDEALQHLDEYIIQLEAEVIETSSLELTQQLHIIRAHLLHYSSLLQSFKKTVEFVLDTPNPALADEQREKSARLLSRECETLLRAVERLDAERAMQEERLENVMRLVFNSVNILDSKITRTMTEAAVRDSAAVYEADFIPYDDLPASVICECGPPGTM
ncbi:hypothetical protein AX15_000247 [Amanita polypyramis BW_CC]|nr:hypothetical protein AX15_000247 [Amanita polypyramis BW_CC]